MRIKGLTITDVEYVAFQLAKELMTWDEPIPDFGTRFPNVLESCLAMTFQGSRGKRHCPNEFETSYSPDRKEIVYCEQCYQAEVA